MMYLLQVTIYTALMYGIYMLVLKNNAQHNWSRAYLLASAVLPLLMPLIYIPAFTTAIPDTAVLAEVSAPVIVITDKIKSAPALSQSTILLLVYMGIGLMFLLKLLWQFIQIRRFVKQHSVEERTGIKVIYAPAIQPGSWGNYIFLPAEEKNDAILNHELAHIRLKHSLDIVLLRLLQCLFWPNLVLYIIEKELKTVHEFQADARSAVNAEQYTQTLLNTLFDTNYFSLSHTFFHKPLKRRISMLGKKTSASMRTRIAIIAGLLTLSLVGSIIFLQGCKREATIVPVKDNMTTAQTAQSNTGEKVYEYVDVMPEAGYNLGEYIGKNLVYPAAAREKKIEGRVLIKFVIDKEGNVRNAIVLHSADSILSAAALNVVQSLPKWKPGKQNDKPVSVYTILPISFKLNNEPPSNNSSEATKNKVLQQTEKMRTEYEKLKKTQGLTETNQSTYIPGVGTIKSNELTNEKNDKNFVQVDKMPSPAFDYNSFLAKNLKYPKEAQDKKIEGKVIIKIIVDKTGKIQHPEIVKSPDPVLSAAALDVVSKMPEWVPGEKDGGKVSVSYTLPIVFKLR